MSYTPTQITATGRIVQNSNRKANSICRSSIAEVTWPKLPEPSAVETPRKLGWFQTLGDCNVRGAFTHTSYNDYEIVAANLLDNDSRRVVHAILDVMYAKALYTTISRAMHIHPTVSELLPTVFQNLSPLAASAVQDSIA